MISAKRIMIFGRAGSGKSTFALYVSKRLNLPLYHLDKYFFIDNWGACPKEEFLKIQQNFVDQEEWIIDGNSINSLEMRYARADIAIYMCYSRILCIWRVIKRFFTKDPAIDDRAPNCKERITFSLLRYMWNFDERVKNIIVNLKSKYPTVEFHKITNDAELKTLLHKLIYKD
jgi:adenylate kinase family enzyme